MFGTPINDPPEKWKNKKLRPTDKFDIYAFGIVLWELYSDEEAFKDYDGLIVIMLVLSLLHFNCHFFGLRSVGRFKVTS